MQRVDIRHSTKKQRESLFDSTISPFLGCKSIGEVEPVDVRIWARTVRLRLTEDSAACGYPALVQAGLWTLSPRTAHPIACA